MLIRSFVYEDIPQVADLHQRVFATSIGNSALSYQTYFRDVFLDHPRQSALSSSLVYEESDRILGFIGVLPRLMKFNGESLRAALCSQFIVDPARRGLVGLRLLRTLLNGKQDLSLTDEANDSSRKIWEGLGGRTALRYNTYWIKPLRPVPFALSLFSEERRFLLPALLSSPAGQLGSILVRCATERCQAQVPEGSIEQLTKEGLLAHLEEFSEEGLLLSHYDEGTLSWLLDRAAQRKGKGSLKMTLVRNGRGEIAGWYIYYENPGAIGEVLQLMGERRSVGMVLDHLFHQARRHGTVAVAGRVEPRFAKEFSNHHCLVHRKGPWVLVHSPRPELLGAFGRGDAFLSRLDGEWCVRFQ